MAIELQEDRVSEEVKQGAALAVLSVPILNRMGVMPGRETRRRVKIAESLATIEGYPDVRDWANATYRTKGARRG